MPVYRECQQCGMTWESREELVRDSAIEVAAYHNAMARPEASLILLRHTHGECGGTFTVQVGDFRHYYRGVQYAGRLTGTPACSGYCLQEHELRPCDAQCELHWARVVLDCFCLHHVPDHID
jgi:hypothetical protein